MDDETRRFVRMLALRILVLATVLAGGGNAFQLTINSRTRATLAECRDSYRAVQAAAQSALVESRTSLWWELDDETPLPVGAHDETNRPEPLR